MKHLSILSFILLVSIYSFANGGDNGPKTHKTNKHILPCTASVTVTQTGSYDCNGTTMTVSGSGSATATAENCSSATQSASSTATAIANQNCLAACIAGAIACGDMDPA